MSWSNVGNAQKNYHQVSRNNYHKPPKPNRYLRLRCPEVSTTTKVIACAMIILVLATPVLAASQHTTKCTTLPQKYLTVKSNAPVPDLRSILVDSSWPSTFHVPEFFFNILPEIPSGLRMKDGIVEFFESFVQRYNTSKTDNYPDLAKTKIGMLDRTLSEEKMISFARGLFNIYTEVETGLYGCLWRSKLDVIGTCWNRIGSDSSLVVDYVRSSLFDLRRNIIQYENEENIIVERSTYEAVQQQAVISFNDNGVFIEVVSHIQDEKFEPSLLLRQEEPEGHLC